MKYNNPFQKKYIRLSTSDSGKQSFKFNALNGPSYYSYEIPDSKYVSAFTYADYSGLDVSDDSYKPSIWSSLCSFLATTICYAVFIITLPLSLIVSLKMIKSYEKLIIFRLGRYFKTIGSGYTIVLPCIDSWEKVDMRMKAFSVPPQKIITIDNAVIEIGAEVFYTVVDPLKSIKNIQDLNHSTRILCQTTLQKHVGKQKLSDIETANQAINKGLRDEVNLITKTWGAEVTNVEMSALKLYSKPCEFPEQSNNPLSLLGPVLFPPGSCNPPVEQLKHFFGLNVEDGKAARSDEAKLMENIPSNVNLAYTSEDEINRYIDEFIHLVNMNLGNIIVKDFSLIYKFILIPDSPNPQQEKMIFFLDLKNGNGRVGKGYPYDCKPDVSLTLNRWTLKELLSKQLSPFNAFIDGKLIISGDLRGGMKLGNLIEHMKRH